MTLRKFMSLAVLFVAGCSASAAPTARVKLDVPDMTCSHCASVVKKSLAKVPGVTEVNVDVEAHSVECVVDPTKFDGDAAMAELKKASYESKLVGGKS